MDDVFLSIYTVTMEDNKSQNVLPSLSTSSLLVMNGQGNIQNFVDDSMSSTASENPEISPEIHYNVDLPLPLLHFQGENSEETTTPLMEEFVLSSTCASNCIRLSHSFNLQANCFESKIKQIRGIPYKE